MRIKSYLYNKLGDMLCAHILRKPEGWYVKRKGGADQIIVVFSLQAYRNHVRPAIKNYSRCKKKADAYDRMMEANSEKR